MNKFEEAVTSYQKALDLDPENDSYKSNLKIAEQKLREVSSPTGTGLSFDMASLINNPAFISMVSIFPFLLCWLLLELYIFKLFRKKRGLFFFFDIKLSFLVIYLFI